MTKPRHICPACGTSHEVHPVLHSLAYGRQLTCSPRCRMDFRKVVRARIFAEMRQGGKTGGPMSRAA